VPFMINVTTFPSSTNLGPPPNFKYAHNFHRLKNHPSTGRHQRVGLQLYIEHSLCGTMFFEPMAAVDTRPPWKIKMNMEISFFILRIVSGRLGAPDWG
jgi:hypothetical protein